MYEFVHRYFPVLFFYLIILLHLIGLSSVNISFLSNLDHFKYGPQQSQTSTHWLETQNQWILQYKMARMLK